MEKLTKTTYKHTRTRCWLKVRKTDAILSLAAPLDNATPPPSVSALSHGDTDGANMEDVSGVARERYLLARWEPNAVNYTSCLPRHFSAGEMAGQDKRVIWQKTIPLKRRCAVKRQRNKAAHLDVGLQPATVYASTCFFTSYLMFCKCVWNFLPYLASRVLFLKTPTFTFCLQCLC